jgi:type IV pilus assembly protein PilW
MSKSMSKRKMVVSRRSRARLRGVSLIELMVALTISLVLVAGAIQVYVYSRKHYEDNEGVARLQETARYALSVIEPDIRMANSWGLLKGSGFVEVNPAGFNTDCGINFAGNVMATLDGDNNQYGFGCAADGAGAIATADTLIVRRASVLPTTSTAPHLVVCSTRTIGRLVRSDSGTTCPPAPIGQLNDLVLNAYYIGRDADQRPGVPTLRRWALPNTSTSVMTEAEIVPGVEDMQIQYGVDPTGTAGTAVRYVNPGQVTAGSQVVSVRLWLLVRGETPEQDLPAYVTPFVYGDRSAMNGTTSDLNDPGAATRAYLPTDRFRRLLVSRTFQIRNAMGI